MIRICGIVVTFHPSSLLTDQLSLLNQQLAEVLVVDNGTFASWPPSLQAALQKPGITLLANPENRGIAAAFNQGLQYALNNGFAWAATFDQDSRPPPHYFAGLWEAHQMCPFRHQVALIAPRYWLKETSPPAPASPASAAWRKIPVAMASGNLVNLQAAQAVGWMDESFFIDYVDFDFCLRLRRQGWQIMEARNVWLPHRLGSRQSHRWLGLQFSLVAHSPLRRYYNARNRIVTYRRHARRFPGWFIHDAAWWLLETAKILLFEPHKAAKLHAMGRGVKDGWLGRMGPAPPALANKWTQLSSARTT
ncbi:MAG: glycosyltransferase family 2 protein [Verrucomicrobiae bacterium]|nr:glycosyltransferase family 2 protein [Verrucomicrobiae bacterium]